MPNPRGRPKHKVEDLPVGWEDKVLDLMAGGGSDVEVRVLLDISIDLWERWLKEEPYFYETIKKGDDLCKAWWMAHGKNQLENTKFSATLWYMNMKNRFGWKDRNDLTTNDKSISLQISQEILDKNNLKNS